MYKCHCGQLLFLSFNDRPVQSLDLVASLVKALNSQDNSRELQFMEISYADDVDAGMLTAQLETLKMLLKEGVFFYVLTTS